MDILPLHFRVLHYGGLWWENNNQHWSVRYIWKPFVIISVFFFALSTTGALALYKNNIKDVTKCLAVSLTVIALFMKMMNFLYQRENMMKLLRLFRETICVPKTLEEKNIIDKNTRIVPIIFKCYLCMAYSTATLFFLLPLFQFYKGSTRVNFPFEAYEIFSKDNIMYYAITYVFQAFVTIFTIAINASLDTILAGFVCLTCAQIDLCCHRFTSASQEVISDNIKKCAVHHCIIKKIVRQIESIFMTVVVPFLFMSLITICTSVYNLSQNGITKAESIPFFIYTGAMLTQVFFYCWFGNELMIKGVKITETMYNYDWLKLNSIEKKNMLYIMFVGQKPLSLSLHGYYPISLDIYVWILNSSYAAYNILKAVTV